MTVTVQAFVLGPLEVRTDAGRPVPIARPKQRALLGALLLHANRPLAPPALTDLLWGERPPPAAASALRTHVAGLRRALEPARLHLAHLPAGYQLDVEAGQLDLEVFERLAAGARQAAAGGDLETAARRWREALALWRGDPLADIPPGGERLRALLVDLSERRWRAFEEAVEVRLRRGEHAELVTELRGALARQPLRERLWAQLITALYRSGRQACALAAYRELRQHLVDELGIEPSPPLQRLHRQVLTADPALAPPVATPGDGLLGGIVPRQLPPDTASFTGRDGELERVLAAMEGGVAPVVALDGSAGVGKSALAIHAAHRLAGRFPDGQLYVNLQGASAGAEPLAPLEALEALTRLLRALGMAPATVPDRLADAATAFRSLLAGRRVLLLLDDARDAAQVRPLLPSSGGCAVLVTSRQVMGSLDAARLHLGALSTGQAVELLARNVGAERVAAEPDAAATIARLCGGLPLALRVAGARLAARPAWPLGALVERLETARRLDELRFDDLEVRASLQVSYQALRDSDADQRAARAFRLLGLPDGPDLGVAVAARLLDAPEPAAERLLERLADAQLLESRAPGRYGLHDLLRLLARELAAGDEPEPSRRAALGRALRCYLATAQQAGKLMRPISHRHARLVVDEAAALPIAGEREALEWMERERGNLMAAVRQASGDPAHAALAAPLATAMFWLFHARGSWQDCVAVNRLAVSAAAAAGDRDGQAQALTDLGYAHLRLHEPVAAAEQLQLALDLRRQAGDRGGQATTLALLGVANLRLDRLDRAEACLDESLAIRRGEGDLLSMASALHNLGMLYKRQGRFEEAIDCYRQAGRIGRERGDRVTEAMASNHLAENLRSAGHPARALAHCHRGLAIARETGDRHAEAHALVEMGASLRLLGDPEPAIHHLEQGLAIRRQLGDQHGTAEATYLLGNAHHDLGATTLARDLWQTALTTFDRLDAPEATAVRALLQPTRLPATSRSRA